MWQSGSLAGIISSASISPRLTSSLGFRSTGSYGRLFFSSYRCLRFRWVVCCVRISMHFSELLPQGSSWVYQTYLDPYFKKNEAGIDAGIAAAQTNIVSFAQEKAAALWDTIWRIATKASNTAGGNAPPTSTSAPSQTPPQTGAQQSPANIMSMGADLFHKYGPWAMGAIQSSLGAAQARTSASTSAGQPGPLPTPPANPTPNSGLHQRSPFASTESVAAPSRPPSFPEPFQ